MEKTLRRKIYATREHLHYHWVDALYPDLRHASSVAALITRDIFDLVRNICLEWF